MSKKEGLYGVADKTFKSLHGREFIPPVQSLMDIDVYKLFMGQFILRYYGDVQVTFKMIVRDKAIKLWHYVDQDELRAALDFARTLRFSKTDIYFLRGMDLYDKYMFSEEYLNFLRSFQLPEYRLENKDGVLDLEFEGSWLTSSMWETIAMAIVSELYYRGVMRTLSEEELRDMYVVADNKLQNKLLDIKRNPSVRFADFGTRRRHSFLWQKYVIGETKRVLGDQFTGTSNLWMAFHYNLNAIGTNAHELPMVATALEDSDEKMRQAQYEVLVKWQEMYGQGLRIILPDTYGSEQFFAGAPSWLADWKGQRQDSGDPMVEVNRYLDWLKGYDIQPADRVSIPSDGLDVPSMIEISSEFNGIHPTPFGYGTGLTNDFAGVLPGNKDMRPFSMVIKPFSANGRPCVKLSNDVSKATGPREEIDRYVRIFGAQHRVERPVLV